MNKHHLSAVALAVSAILAASATQTSFGSIISSGPAGGTTLTPPVAITYSGSSNAFSVADSGSGRGLSATLTNSNNSNSAVYGETKGKGAGVKGLNYGTEGPAGIFQINNAASAQPGLFAVTAGTGPAIQAHVTASDNYFGAIIADNPVGSNYGV